MLIRFSVLLPMMADVTASQLNAVLHSVWEKQTLMPAELVVIECEPLTSAQKTVLKRWQLRLEDKFIRVLAHDLTLAGALNLGLTHCHWDLVAKVDANTESHPQRFELQIGFMHERTDVVVLSCATHVSSQAKRAFYQKDHSLYAAYTPTTLNDIMILARKGNPLHPAGLVYRKGAVEANQGYLNHRGLEDYNLVLRLLDTGYKLHNLPETLITLPSAHYQTAISTDRHSEWQLFKLKDKLGLQSPLANYTTLMKRLLRSWMN